MLAREDECGPQHLDQPVLDFIREDFAQLNQSMTACEALDAIRQKWIGEKVVYFHVVDVNKRRSGATIARKRRFWNCKARKGHQLPEETKDARATQAGDCKMKTRRFDHIDLRVKEMAAATPFYAQLLPALGFTVENSSDEWCMWQAAGSGPVEFFAFDEDRKHQPNESRIAFWAESRAEVDRLAEVVRQAGGLNLEGPALWREYSPGYYALFFEDPSGNKLEICCRQSLAA